VVDPGHGRPDPGAIGPSGYFEADAVLDVGLRVKELFVHNHEIEIVLTRESETAPYNDPGRPLSPHEIKKRSLWKRVRIAEELGADLFISIHCNGAKTPKAEGFEVIHNGLGEAAAKHIYRVMRARLKSHRGRKCINYTAHHFRPYVLHHNPVPAVIIELEFITNPEQEEILKRENSRQFYAETIARGIEEYFDPEKSEVIGDASRD